MQDGKVSLPWKATRGIQLNLIALISWWFFTFSIGGLILNIYSLPFSTIFLISLVGTGICTASAGSLVVARPPVDDSLRNDGKLLLPLGSACDVRIDLEVYLICLGLAAIFGVYWAGRLLDSLVLAAALISTFVWCGIGIIYLSDFVKIMRARGDR